MLFDVFDFIYFRCIHEMLQNKLVVLVTHQIQYALKADKILLIKEVSSKVFFLQYREKKLSFVSITSTRTGYSSSARIFTCLIKFFTCLALKIK